MAAAGPPKGNRFFDAAGKRGEIQEFKEELNHASKEKKKEALKKVIQAMTVGSDVSSLFPDVVNCMQTSSMDLKKLVYLYVINYAKAQPDLAILAIHSFRKDANDQHNPLLRALAVRTMGCIRLEQMTEYLLEPLRRSCRDPDPYVRKTATICIAKLFDINPELVEDQGFVDVLRDMLGDSNPMVVANAVASLCEISSSSRRNHLQLNEDVISKLLPALNECSEWGQVFILDALAQYDPPNSTVARTILERAVNVRLSHANSAVVLSAVKVMMKFMDRIQVAEEVRKLCKRMTPPLVTLLSAEPEVQYCVLRNVSLIVQKQPQVLHQEVRMFVCKYNDPLYVKLEKIHVMVQLASERNVDQVLPELEEYASEVDIECVRQAVRAIGQCAIKLGRAAERCVDCLLKLIKTRVSYVVQEAIVVIRDIFRRYPGRYEVILTDLCEGLDSLDEPEAKAAMVWIVGEYAERIDNSQELLEFYLEGFHEEPAAVRLQLLTSTVKLFLKQPGAQELVRRALRLATEESSDPDLRDRGYVYWRLLSRSPDLARRVVLSERPTISDAVFATEPRLLERLVAGISTLASVYHRAPESFLQGRGLAQPGEEDAPDTEPIVREMERRQRAGETYVEESGDEESAEEGSSSSEEEERPPLRAMQTVLQEQTPGHRGLSGLRVAALLARGPRGVRLQLMLGNFADQPLSGWALQVNRNPFGLAPLAALEAAELQPGQTASAEVLVGPSQAQLSGQAPQAPLYLEVAIRTSLDVFYLSVGYDLSCVLEGPPMAQEQFQQLWRQLEKQRLLGQLPQQVAPEQVAQRLEAYGVRVLTRQPQPDADALYLSCRTTNGLQVLAELSLRRSAPQVQLLCCSEAPPLVPLLQAHLQELLRLRWAPAA